MLIYFEPVLARQVTELLSRSLRPGGTIMLGVADVLQVSPARTGGPRPPLSRQARPAREQATGLVGGPVPETPRQAMRVLSRGPLPTGQRVLTRDQRLTATLTAAASGDRHGALEHAASLVKAHPLDADAHFLYGLVALEAGEPAKARDALRQALVADPAFCIAAFTLGRAYDALGDGTAARRSYLHALRILDPNDRRHESLLQQVDLADIAAACRARLDEVLTRAGPVRLSHTKCSAILDRNPNYGRWTSTGGPPRRTQDPPSAGVSRRQKCLTGAARSPRSRCAVTGRLPGMPGYLAGLASCASWSACCGNQVPAAGSSAPHSGSNSCCWAAVAGQPGWVYSV